MHTKLLNILAGIALATGALSATASSATVATIPMGMMSFTLASGSSNYLSLPLTNTEIFTSVVSSVTANTIAVADSPAPFTTNLATPATPYFVKFLSGSEAGRVLLITANTTSVLTLDTSDHSTGSVVALTTSAFSVQAGDSFEIFPGDTLASIFGSGTTASPLVLTGGDNAASSDTVTLYTVANSPPVTYYFNTVDGQWEQYAAAIQHINANNTIIYPYSAFVIDRRQSHPDTAFVVVGRVTRVAVQTKVEGSNTTYASTHYATDITLAQLQFGPNWVTGSNIASADTISVWNAVTDAFDTYYQKPDSTWRKYPDAVTDQSNFTITAGTVTAIAKREAVSGAATFVQSPLPYSLD